jgi:RNA polymerase sigma-70 factor (ECF subfamily)
MSGALSDDELMRRCQAGEGAAFEELARRYRSRLERMASRWQPKDATPEEVAQDVLSAAYEARHHYRAEGCFASWLFSLAANHLRNLERAYQRRRRALGLEDTPSEPQARAMDSPSEGTMAVWSALGHLPPSQRAALLLHELYGFSHEEIADLFGVKPGTARSWASRARQQVRALLSDHAPKKGDR